MSIISKLIWKCCAVLFSVTLANVSLVTGSFAQQSAQQSGNQQRPRRVSGTDNAAPAKPSTGEEIDEGDVVRVDTQLVSVPAVITDAAGHPLSGLKPENFQIFEDGQIQKIANFGTAETPFEIALLLDTSGSTREDVVLIRQAANSFIDALRSGDRVGIVAFNTIQRDTGQIASVEVLSSLTSDRKALHKAIENLGASNGTPYYDALQTVAAKIFRDPAPPEVKGRRAVVALTDGVDSTSDSDFASSKLALARAGIACYFIQVNTEDFVEDRLMKDCEDDGRLTLSQKQLLRYQRIFVPGAKADDYTNFCQMGQFERMQISRDLYNLARREMNDLARVSGGRAFVAANLSDARSAFARVAEDIGTFYSIGYYPTNKARDGKFRTIKVEVNGTRDKPEVRARNGYYAPRQ
ncbi:MAG: VWA domain-containing protein [Pyrinomonadaceae bacterium]